ncbi:hypothetical protein RBS60_14910 [Sinomonas sp. ASV486]|uniref:hypothetical protein n=1 Tax=Sinomonas sp. ASV486 TaxID=3051170 RepID=UPI0027DD37FD|nr:hypothetical protein [Sinomonas sp. ASV486]MDQ4491490.1 hypothetical protein [Sinomonas sp. ASV486]
MPSPTIHPAPVTATPPILTAGSPFTAVELQAMEADGMVRRLVGRAYVPVRARTTAELRARALSAMLTARVRERAVAGRMTAAWILGCAPPPEMPVMLVESTRRLARLGTGERLLVHEVSFGDFDVLEIADLRVTSALRTAVDLAIHSEERIAVPVLRRLLAREGLGLTVGLMVRSLEGLPAQPHKTRARRILERLQS